MKIKCEDFSLSATLDSGQVFGFTRADGAYEGVLLGHPVTVSQSGGYLDVRNGRTGLREEVVRHYFDLDRDLNPVFSILGKEEVLGPALKTYRGLRVIRQDHWEALACFIISSNNNVKRIMGIYRNLTAHFGKFPSPLDVARSHETRLRQWGLGYRAPFLWATARFLSSNPEYLDVVRKAGYGEARERVLAFPGIGPKVADCALLYGFHKLEAFPVDVWILRAMRALYFRNRRVSEAKVRDFAMRRWKGDAGYVQQYLFHSARMGVYDTMPASRKRNKP